MAVLTHRETSRKPDEVYGLIERCVVSSQWHTLTVRLVPTGRKLGTQQVDRGIGSSQNCSEENTTYGQGEPTTLRLALILAGSHWATSVSPKVIYLPNNSRREPSGRTRLTSASGREVSRCRVELTCRYPEAQFKLVQ